MINNIPTVSVIIPVYNTESFLPRCLDSIFAQDYQDMEVICVNDSSTDGCQEILERYQNRYPQQLKIIVNDENMKAGPSKDKAVKTALGKYIVYIDSDDYIKPDYLNKYVTAIETYGVDIVIGGYIKDIHGKYVRHNVKNNVWALTTYVIACSKMYRKDFIIEHFMEFGNNTCLEDMYFNLTGFCHHPSFHVLTDYEGYYYYYNSDSVTSTYDFRKNHEQQTIAGFDLLMKKCDFSSLDKDSYWVLQYTYLANMINSLVTYNRHCGIQVMKNKYDIFVLDLKKRFPDYKKNPYLRIGGATDQIIKIRWGVGVTMLLHRVGLSRLLFYVLSLI